jgi:geranylgeranyl reductase family protein
MKAHHRSVADVDVLVVGGGPAGAAAAYHLARAGARVLVADRARFPRDKVCGDGLMPRAVGALLRMGIDIDEPGFGRIVGGRAIGRGGRDPRPLDTVWTAGRRAPSFGLVRRRFELDALLLDRAASAGADVQDGTEVTTTESSAGRVVGATLRDDSPGAEPTGVGARFVVVADGASGRTAARLGLPRRPGAPLAVAARRYYRARRPVPPFFAASVGIPADGAPRAWLPGYGWVFPTADGHANVGAYLVRSDGAEGSAQISAQAALDAFLAGLPTDQRFDPGDAAGPVRSSAIPMGLDRVAAAPGILVAGDAAGITNPFTGEGIGYAMESGELAARLIGRALAGGADPSEAYADELRRRYERPFRAGRGFVRLISRPRVASLAARYGTRVPWFSRRAMRFMLDAG